MPGGAGQPLATILEEIERDPHGYFWTKEARSWRLLPKPISPIIQDFVTCLLDEYCQDPGSQGGRSLSYFWRRNRVTLIEHKPTLNPMEWAEVPFVQFLYDPAAGTWTLFSADRKGRWRTYEGVPCGSDIQTLLAVVDEDPTGSIWIERTPRRHPCGSHLTWTQGKWIATNSLPFPSQVPSEG